MCVFSAKSYKNDLKSAKVFFVVRNFLLLFC